jgi:hypothetical protein
MTRASGRETPARARGPAPREVATDAAGPLRSIDAPVASKHYED